MAQILKNHTRIKSWNYKNIMVKKENANDNQRSTSAGKRKDKFLRKILSHSRNLKGKQRASIFSEIGWIGVDIIGPSAINHTNPIYKRFFICYQVVSHLEKTKTWEFYERILNLIYTHAY